MRLQLLAEGGEGAAEGEGTADALSGLAGSATSPRGRGKGAAEEGKGGSEGSGGSNGGTGAGEGGEGAAVDLEAEFDALVKGDGKFREVFAKRQAAATRSRNKGLQQIAAKYNALGPALDVLAARYGVAADDPALVEQIANDNGAM